MGEGLPPLLLHRHRTSSPSFTLRGVEQLLTANGCTEKNVEKMVQDLYMWSSQRLIDSQRDRNEKFHQPQLRM